MCPWFGRSAELNAGPDDSMSELTAPKVSLSEPLTKDADELLRRLGPGLVTGAADDDPSGIATYSQAGAQFGFSMLWVMLFSFPLMAAVQEICGRLGRITGMGVAANLAKCYPKAVVRSLDRKSTRLNSSHIPLSRMPS